MTARHRDRLPARHRVRSTPTALTQALPARADVAAVLAATPPHPGVAGDVEALRDALAAQRRALPAVLVPSAAQAAALLAALSDVRARDAVADSFAGPARAAAIATWATLEACAPGRYRAAPATLLAICAYVVGDAAAARAALGRALLADPGYRLAAQLRALVDAGVAAGAVRAAVAAGAAAARAAGRSTESR